MMSRRLILCLAAAVVGLVGLAPASAQSPSATAPAPEINPAAVKALTDMGVYLRGLEAFQVSVATTDEDVLDDGQKVQYDGRTELLVKRPDRLRASVTNERKDRMFFYDGKNVTLYGKRLNYYASAAAPPTIRELADKLEDDYGMNLPLVDLFRWGAPGYEPKGFTAALDAGPSSVGGATARHYLFRQAGLDWQVWIQSGQYPLPLKLVITTTTDDARPQHTAVYTWNLAPSYNDAAFVFDPPAGSGRIVLARDKQGETP
jgi:hypothetical protein